MKGVYIIYEKDGYGGSTVGAVFASRKSARVYVKEHIFGKNTAYAIKNEDDLDALADSHIDYHEVEV